MAELRGKWITLAGSFMTLYKDQQKKADEYLFSQTGKHWNEVDQEGWYDTKIFGRFLDCYAEGSITGEKALVTLGRQIYPTIKKTVGLPPQLKTAFDLMKFEAEGFLQNHRGFDVKPRKFVKVEDRDIVVQAPAPGYNAKLYEGVYLGILELCGVKSGKVVMSQSMKSGDTTDEFHITW